MRHPPPESISTLDSTSSDDGSVHRLNDSSVATPLSTAPQSRRSSVKSISPVPQNKEQRSSLKSSLKTSKSTSSLSVRFAVPDPPPAMPALEVNALRSSRRDGWVSPQVRSQSLQRASLDIPDRPPARTRMHKRLSAPAPISRKEGKGISVPPVPLSPSNPRVYSTATPRYTSRVTSYQSFASAPAALESAPSPSQPPSQYNPLQHYVPCLEPKCKNHYTSSLLGLTFYSPQQPYQLIRKRGLCPLHAHQDLKLANRRVKSTWESMRQNAGRKTLGLIAAEFEIFVEQLREERSEESQRMLEWQKQRVLGSAPSAKGKEKAWNEEWDWRYSPRACTRKNCDRLWYSPFDNRLYLFYTTPRPSGLVPLNTLCPTCAKEDVETVEEKIGSKGKDAGDVVALEWEEWYEQAIKDRQMEVEFWEQAQERVVREKAASVPVVVDEQSEANPVVKPKKSRKLKVGICAVM